MRLISKPVLCNYYVTFRCNARCGFCDIWERPSPLISLPELRQNLADLKSLGVKIIDFTGGEPLLHPDLHLFLTEARQLGFITTVTTNGLLYPKRARKLQGLVDMLHFSLDSANRSTHDAMRGTPCFDKVMESISLARELGEKPDILFTVFNHNADEIDQVYNEIILPNNLVLILNPVFSYHAIKESLDKAVMLKLGEWAKKENVYLNEGFLQLRKDGGNHINNPVCRAGSSTIVISPDNELITPCYHLGMKSFPIEGRLAELYKSREVQENIKMEGKMDACEGCAINCYMQPSFAVEINKYWWKALPGTLKYNRIKGTWKRALWNRRIPLNVP